MYPVCFWDEYIHKITIASLIVLTQPSILQFNFQTRLSFLSRTFFRPWFELYHHNSICISFSQHSSKASLGNNIPRRFSPQELRGLKPRNCGAWSASLPLGWQGKLKALGNLGLPGSWKHLKLGLKKDSWYELSKLFDFPFSDPRQKQTNICKSYKYLVKLLKPRNLMHAELQWIDPKVVFKMVWWLMMIAI